MVSTYNHCSKLNTVDNNIIGGRGGQYANQFTRKIVFILIKKYGNHMSFDRPINAYGHDLDLLIVLH